MAKPVIDPHPQDRLMHRLATVDKWPLKKIGEHVGGVTKQMVSQRIHHLQNEPLDPYRSKRPSPAQLVAVCDKVYSSTEAARKLGIGKNMLDKMLRDFELFNTYKHLWKFRKKQIHRRRLIRILRLIANNVGHTPTIDEVNSLAKETKGRIPYHTAWVGAFGSFNNAQKFANLTPNKRGHQKKTPT